MVRDSTVRLISNGAYWQVKYWDTQGRLVRRSIGPKAQLKRRDALAKAQALAVQFAAQPGRRDPQGRRTLEEWGREYLALRNDLAPSSVQSVKQTIAMLTGALGASSALGAVRRADAEAFVAGLRAPERALSEASIRLHVRNCKTFFQRAVHMDLIAVNPFDRIKSAVPDVDHSWAYLDDEKMGKILEACPNSDWRCLIALCRWAGLRRGEAVRLAWADVDWTASTLTVEHQGQQTTKKKRRTVPIQPRLYTVLREAWENRRTGSVRPFEQTGSRLTALIAGIVQRAKVERYSKLFHTLRKNAESDWLSEFPVMDVAAWMGHSPSVAAKHYHQTTKNILDRATGRTLINNQRADPEIGTKLAQTEPPDATELQEEVR